MLTRSAVLIEDLRIAMAAALRLGVTQQTCSTLERSAESVGAARLLKLPGILGAELVLSKPGSAAVPPWSAVD